MRHYKIYNNLVSKLLVVEIIVITCHFLRGLFPALLTSAQRSNIPTYCIVIIDFNFVRTVNAIVIIIIYYHEY